MSLVLKDDKKGKKMLTALQKPSVKAMVNQTIPNGYELIERLEKRLTALEQCSLQDHKLLFNYVEEVEGLKREICELKKYSVLPLCDERKELFHKLWDDIHQK